MKRGLGRNLLLGFIVISVILIIAIWRENLMGIDEGTPSYYRDTFVIDERVRATMTAEASAAERAGTPTRSP